MIRTKRFRLTASDVGRQISDEGWEVLEPFHIECWKWIERYASRQRFSRRNVNYVVSANLTAAIRELNHRYTTMRKLFHFKNTKALEDFRHDDFDLVFDVEEEGDFKSKFSDAEDIVEYLIFEIFTILNLAAPGSCDLSSAVFASDPVQYNIRGGKITSDIRLSGHPFESALYEARDIDWLRIEGIDISSVAHWVNEVCPSLSMLPDNPAAKSIFSLQHIARRAYDPTSIIWVFYGLESFFQCKPGENFRSLIDRISALLEIDEKSRKDLSKRFRDLYDLRSSIVHGGHRVSHPLHNGLLTEEEEKNSWKYVEHTEFGCAVLIACIQRVIELGWKYPLFCETIAGAELTPPPPPPFSPPSPHAPPATASDSAR